jgi:hypothetical protein
MDEHRAMLGFADTGTLIERILDRPGSAGPCVASAGALAGLS